MPNFRGRRFTNAHETMIWAARDEKAKGYTFNYEALKAANEDVQARSDWLIPLCTGEERLKGARRQEGSSDAEAGRPARARAAVVVEARRSRDRSLQRHRHHRRRRQTSRPPLHRLRARPDLRQGGRKRASPRSSRCRKRRLAPFMTARDAPRVAFSELIERGMILPGTKLVDAKKRHGALVRADGAIMLGDKVGSIHRIGAVAQGAEACNGWTFWHVETKKGLKLIDELRAEIRAGMAAG